MLVSALFGGPGIPFDLLHLTRNRHVVEREHVDAFRQHAGDVSVLEIDDLARMGHDGRDVAGDDRRALADADDQRGPLAGDDHLPWMPSGNHGDSVGALHLLEGLRDRGEEIAPVKCGDEMRQDLGVRLRDEHAPARLELRPQRGVVLDDAIVHQGQVPAIGDMGVCVDLGRQTMRRPARMRNAQRIGRTLALGQRRVQQPVQFGDFPRPLEHPDVLLGRQGDSGRIVASIFEAPKTIHQRSAGANITTRKSNDATHDATFPSLSVIGTRPPRTLHATGSTDILQTDTGSVPDFSHIGKAESTRFRQRNQPYRRRHADRAPPPRTRRRRGCSASRRCRGWTRTFPERTRRDTRETPPGTPPCVPARSASACRDCNLLGSSATAITHVRRDPSTRPYLPVASLRRRIGWSEVLVSAPRLRESL